MKLHPTRFKQYTKGELRGSQDDAPTNEKPEEQDRKKAANHA
jgi:hypothetical protein